MNGAFELGEGAFGLFTSKLHGNLSSVSGEGSGEGHLARVRLREQLGVERLARGYQAHGTVVGRVLADPCGPGEHNGLADDEASREQPRFLADGHAVAAPGVAAMVLVADCVPVLLAAEGAVAALHAGWRGLAAGVLEEGVNALAQVGGSGPVSAVVGPCAGVCCYEVGEEVHSAFGGGRRQTSRIDLRAIAAERLRAAGVADVRHADACTICDERFFSHRREAQRAGRQAGLAWLA